MPADDAKGEGRSLQAFRDTTRKQSISLMTFRCSKCKQPKSLQGCKLRIINGKHVRTCKQCHEEEEAKK